MYICLKLQVSFYYIYSKRTEFRTAESSTAATLSSLASSSKLPRGYSSEPEEDNPSTKNDVSDPDELSLSDTIAGQKESKEDELSIYMDDIGALLRKMPQSSISSLPAKTILLTNTSVQVISLTFLVDT